MIAGATDNMIPAFTISGILTISSTVRILDPPRYEAKVNNLTGNRFNRCMNIEAKNVSFICQTNENTQTVSNAGAALGNMT